MGKRVVKIMVLVIGAVILVQAGRMIFQEEEYRARNFVYEQVKENFPGAYRQMQAAYGLSAYDPETREDRDGRPGRKKPVVILVHGLDEPGRIWLNLAPALFAEGYRVLFMSYPNDQKITDSARLFFESLGRITDHLPDPGGLHPVHIVCHSMGGLVTRQMLTAPEIGYGAAAEAGRVPRISTLIMVGTPNHGSELARFRIFMEIRDQVHGLFDPDTGQAPKWLRGVLDGTGAAGMDLLPGSRFLTRLNSRPHPRGVRMHVIAGILSPWSGKDIRGILQEMEEVLPGQGEALAQALAAVADGVGDGLVPLSSARLDRVPLTRVRGTHLTMIRNLTRASTRVPPAVPVILDILHEQSKKGSQRIMGANFYGNFRIMTL